MKRLIAERDAAAAVNLEAVVVLVFMNDDWGVQLVGHLLYLLTAQLFWSAPLLLFHVGQTLFSRGLRG